MGLGQEGLSGDTDIDQGVGAADHRTNLASFDAIDERLEPEDRQSEEEGTLRRAAEGRFAEPLPTSRPDRLNDPG